MPKDGACNLGSLNLSEFVKNPFTKQAEFDVEDFKEAVQIAIEGLDEVIDENLKNHALARQREMSENYRNIGLGIMGMHDCLIKLGIVYGSEQSVDLIDNIMGIMFRTAVIESSSLAKRKGRFPAYKDNLLESDIIKNHFTDEELDFFGIKANGLRNCSLLSVAPTGSLGTMLNISTGCEPLFALYYNRKTESLNGGEDKNYKVYSGVVREYVEQYGDNLPKFFNCSGDIAWKDRVDMQAVIQDHVDTAISSTVNLPNETTVEEIEQLYLYAWSRGVKGITIYRDGCARAGVLTHDKKKEEKKPEAEKSAEPVYDYIIPVSRKTLGTTTGSTYCKKSACGTLYITINQDKDGNVVESFVSASKGGICQSNINAVNRMISLALRSGTKVDEIVDQLRGITCPACVKTIGKGKPIDGISCPDIIAKTLSDFYKEYKKQGSDPEKKEEKKPEVKKEEEKPEVKEEQEVKDTGAKCPDCGAPLAHEGGCVRCTSCGYSKCG